MGTYTYDWPEDVQDAFTDATLKGLKETRHFMSMDKKWAVKLLDTKEAAYNEADARLNSKDYAKLNYSKKIARIDKACKMIADFEQSKIDALLPKKPEILEQKVACLEHEIVDIRNMAVNDRTALQAEVDSLKVQVNKHDEVAHLKARIQALLQSTDVDLEAQD